MLLEEMVFGFLYYGLIYLTFFVSVFWFSIFFRNKDNINKNPHMPKKLPSVTIIVPAYNEEKRILETLESLLNQNYPKEKLSVIVVDDASTDNTFEIANNFAENLPNVKVIRHKGNRKKAASLNTGFRYVKSEIVGFIDGDSVLTQNSLRKMVGYLKEKNVGSVIPNIQPKNNKTFCQKIQKIEYIVSALMRKLLTFINSLYMTPAFALYRTELIRKVGGWDSKNLAEDLEMGLRLQNEGYKIETCLTAEIKTSTPENFRNLWRQRIRWYRGLIHNSKKYRHIFFNSKFGDLGIFILPFNFIILFFAIPIFLYGFWLTISDFAHSFINLSLIGFDFQYIIMNLRFFSSLNTFNFMIFVLVIGFFFILVGLTGRMRKGIKKYEYIIYIALYPVINILFWLSVLYYEIRGSEFKW